MSKILVVVAVAAAGCPAPVQSGVSGPPAAPVSMMEPGAEARAHRAEPAPTATPTAHPAPVTGPWWCIGFGLDNIGPCWDSAALCEDQRVDFIAREPHFSPCAPQASAACFTLDYPTLGVMESCHTNAKACRLFYDTVAGEGRALTACRVLDKPAPGVRLFRRPEPPPAVPPVPESITDPTPPDPAPRDPMDLRRWWCWRADADSWGDCSKTRDDCNLWRARLVTARFKEPCQLTDQACVDEQANALALGITACQWQPRVSCFMKHFKLLRSDSEDCAPTIKICKSRRASTLKDSADDVTVKSDCATRD